MKRLLLLMAVMQICASVEDVPAITITDVVDKNAEAEETVLTSEDFEAAPEEDLDLTRLGIHVKPDPTMGNHTEGDIAIKDVKRFIEDSNKLARNAIRQVYRRWPNAEIPYTLSTQYGAYSRSVIAKAMHEYHQKTCVRFVARDAGRHKDYVYIHPDDGCYSLVGRTGGRQPLSLDSGCIQTGTIVHELMHAVGFFHEQSRADRDYYIEIIWSNVLKGANDQFEKYGLNVLDHLNEPYDYSSIMHYGAYAFSDNGKRTIIARQAGSERMGQRVAFTEIDLRKINKLYGCPLGRPITGNSINDAAAPSVVVCEDRDWRCSLWSLPVFGRCDEFEIAYRTCPRSCGSCSRGTEQAPSGGSQTTDQPPTAAASSTLTPSARGGSRECRDRSPACERWALLGRCASGYHLRFMRTFCEAACGLCTPYAATTIVVPRPPCEDTAGYFRCTAIDILGRCDRNADICAKTCGFCEK